MRRHSAYGFTPGLPQVAAGGMFASALTDAGVRLSSGGSTRSTFTVPTLSADVYTPSGGTGAGAASSTFPDVNAGLNFLPFDAQPSQTVTPDYMRAQAGVLTLPATQETRRSTPLRAVLPPGARSSTPTPPSGRAFSFGPSRATLPAGARRTLPWTSITSAPVDMPTLDTGLFSETPSMDTVTDTYTVPALDTRGGIGGYTKDGGYYVVPTMPGGPAVRKGAQEKKAVAAPAPAPDAGFPWGWLLLAAGVGGAYLFTRKKGSAS